MALFCYLRYSRNFFSIPFENEKIGWRRQVTIPYIMMDDLIMPNSFSGVGIQRNKTVRIQIATRSVTSIKIKGSGTCGNVDDLILAVECHSHPGIRTAIVCTRFFRPGITSKLQAVRDGVKCPD